MKKKQFLSHSTKCNLLAICGFLSFCFMLAYLFCPELIGIGVLSLAFPPVGNFYDNSAHNADGSTVWYLERIDKATNATVAFGQVSGVKVMNPGTGYAEAPTVGFSGGGGTGAAATALISNGMVVKIVMTNNGNGYTSAPTVTITPAEEDPGTGAAATAFWSDGWHIGPGRMKVKFAAGQEDTDVIGEDKQVFDTTQEEAKGEFLVTSIQNDTWTKNFFGKEAHKYDWRVFQHIGPSRGEFFTSYRLIAKVRFPKLTEEERQGGTIDLKGKVLSNKSAVSTTNSNLPVAGLVGNYNIPAKELYAEDEEVVIPTI